MPLQLKKPKFNRISRFLVDLQSRKTGGSLPVQTGFPTSLVDVFVESRNRLRKNSNKKQKQKPSKVSDLKVPMSSSLVVNSICLDDGKMVDGNTGLFEVDHLEKGLGDSVLSDILLLVPAVFVMAALTLGTKKVAIGITFSAFTLHFIAYVGMNLFCFLRLSDAKTILKSTMQRFFVFIRSNYEILARRTVKVSKSEIEEMNTCDLIECVELRSVESNFKLVGSIEEIQNAQSDLTFLGENRRSAEMDRKKKAMEDDDSKGETAQPRTKSDKVKDKILKKLVPKKLRNTLKKIKNRKEEKKREASSSSAISLEESEEDEEEYLEAASDFEEGRRDFEKVDNADPSAAEENRGSHNRGYSGFVIIILLILVGLFGGRVQAIALTFGWCLLLTSVRYLRRYKRNP